MIRDDKLQQFIDNQPKSALIETHDNDVAAIANIVSDFLILKSSYEGIRHDHKHQTLIGGCSFYFTIKEDGSYYLSSTTHPSQWVYKNIKYDIFQMEKSIYSNMGKAI